MNKKGSLFVISGPSGAGKGTLLRSLFNRLDPADFYVSVSYATRKPRQGEINGIHYHFVTEESFQKMLEEDKFIEYNHYCHGYYGTLAAPMIQALQKGLSSVLEIDYNGMKQVEKKYPSVVRIFIAPPSIEILEKRLRGRGTETQAQIAKRIQTARDEMQKIDEYDYIVVNDDLAKATDELVCIFKKYICTD